ncbi:MAG: ATP synthase F1 subunit epsilon [Clostridiales bacterium]|nr:ATP synthase F1 subunit epsilon [Clostridiales bacterium]
MADSNVFHLQVISPDRIFYEGDVTFLELNTTEGEIGILAGHIPLTSIVAPGILRITSQDEVKEAALHEGFIEILPDKVLILAESCEWPEEIDLNRAKEAQIRAERRLKSNDSNLNMARAELALHKALLRIEIGEHADK